MKVILLRDVAKIGKRFEIREVPDGYALNKLIPKKDAIPATPANVKRVNERERGSAKADEEAIQRAQTLVESCTSEPLEIALEANEQGHLFQAVHTSDVVTALKARGFEVSANDLSFSQPVKAIGLSEVILKVAGRIFQVPITIVAK